MPFLISILSIYTFRWFANCYTTDMVFLLQSTKPSKKPSLSSFLIIQKMKYFTSIRFTLLGVCCFLSQCLFAQVSGVVFRDYNANGIKDTYEIGVGGVIVKAINSTGTIFGPVISAANGTYSIASVPNGQQVRLEFSIPASLGCFNEKLEQGASTASGGATSVQFIVGGTNSANFGLNFPDDYVISNPWVATTCFVNGDITKDKTQLHFGTQLGVSDLDVAVKFPFNAAIAESTVVGMPRPNNSPPITPNNTYMSFASQMGAIWGVSYQKKSDKLFYSALMRRHAHFGPLGTGGIYMVNAATGTTFNQSANYNFIDVKTIGIDTGIDPHPSTGLGAVIEGDILQCDAASFDKIGKIGIGDLDISTDGQYLFLTNLNDRKLYKIKINNPATIPTSADVTAYNTAPWLSLSCANGVARPWAVKYYRDKVYVGIVCTGENGGTVADLSAKIYELDALTGIWNNTPVIDIPLNYTKGMAASGTIIGSTDNGTHWNPWFAYMIDDGSSNNNFTKPTPILSDIEIDTDGSFIVGLMDRTGHQLGLGTKIVLQNGTCVTDPNRGFGPYISVSAGGDLLRIGRNNCLLAIESNANDGEITSSGTANGQGIGGGEFYWGDYLGGAATNHQETFVGGLALQNGSNQVLGTIFDPFGYISGGISYFNNTTGGTDVRYELFPPNAPAAGTKGNTLGDLELLNPPAPIEVGNRIYKEIDNDGIQDANEVGIAGVTVRLFNAGVEVASTITDGNGNYTFKNLLSNSDYEIRVISASFPSGSVLTLSNQSDANAFDSDAVDNDATLVSGNAVIAFRTGLEGQNNHTLDIGFWSCPLPNCGTVTVTKN